MGRYFSILFFLLLNLTAFSQSFSDGFKVGYKAGYCYNEIGCVAPPAVPTVPKPGKNTYQDGYNDGFAKGQADKASKTVNNRTNTTIQNTPTRTESVDYNDAFNKGYNQAQQNVKTQLEIEQKRAELEKQQIELLRIREEQERAYEAKVIKQPELDFNSGKMMKFKIRNPNKYTVQIFNPDKWYQMSFEDDAIYGQRDYDDGTKLSLKIKPIKSPNGKGVEFINARYDTLVKVPKVQMGILWDVEYNGVGRRVSSVLLGGGAYRAGIKAGDIVTKVDTILTNDKNYWGNATVNKNPGDSIRCEFKRNNDDYYTYVTLSEREGYYYGKGTISNFPYIFNTQIREIENYGTKKKVLDVRNYVAVGGEDIFLIQYLIEPNSEFANMDSVFKRFQNTFKTHLNSIVIE